MSSDGFSSYSIGKQAELVQRFMVLFEGSKRGYGYGRREGVRFNPEKNKNDYVKESRYIGWRWEQPTEVEFRAHLMGDQALGIGPLFDDGTTNRGEIDVDKIGTDNRYEFDYFEEMGKITRSKIPLVVYRTKSSGLRLVLFFTEPIDADLVRQGMANISAMLGYSGNEIFPKQTKLAKEDDAPSWTFLPYGPMFEIFAEQCGMTDSGNALTLEEFIELCEGRRISREDFQRLAFQEYKSHSQHNGNGHANGHNNPKRPRGIWAEETTVVATIKETFKGGPPCLFYIANRRCLTGEQHNYLFNVGLFLKRKYVENWEEAFKWVNFNALAPPGDPERLMALIKDVKARDYEYRCKDEPICSHCMADACRRMPYGVGNGRAGVDHYELGVTIVNKEPRTYIINVGAKRIRMTSFEMITQSTYRVKCLENGVDFPPMMKRDEWDNIIKRSLTEATVVEPPEILRSHANEIEILEQYLGIHIPNMVRSAGMEFTEGKVGDVVRVKLEEQSIYFKWRGLAGWCRRALSMNERALEVLRVFVTDQGREIKRDEMRDWYRSTLCVPFTMFDAAIIDRWLTPDG